MILALVAAVTVTFSPAKPTVGDPITIAFDQPVMLDFSYEYEQVTRYENVVVVRTFTPKPIVLSGTSGHKRFRNLQIPVYSVLKDGDDLRPAPLAPPRPMRWSWWWVAIAAAVLVAIALALWLWLRARKRAPVEVVPVATPEERFRAAVMALRANPSASLRWAALADETRKFLAATRPQFGSDLTTTELVPRLDERERVVEEILRQGDLEKFSRRGAKLREFDELADRVLELAS